MNLASKQIPAKKHIVRLVTAGFYLVFGALCYRLFLRMAIRYPGALGNYDSDIPAHIIDGVKGSGYSLAELIYRFLMQTLHLNQKPVAALISLSVLGTVWFAWILMKKIAPDVSPALLHVLSFVCVMENAIFIPALNAHRYLGVQGASCWHNDTYTMMRFAAVPVMLLFFRLRESYLKEIRLRDFILFTLALTVTNWFKPNFFIAFAPAMLLVLIGDFAASRGKTVLRQILFGIPVLLSMGVLIFQTSQLFINAESAAESSGFPIGFSIAYILRRNAAHPVCSLLQSAAFPIVVLVMNRRRFRDDRIWSFSWLMWAVGLFEYLFLHENGSRMNHGNLSWGYCFCLYFIFVICAAYYCRSVRELILQLRGIRCAAGTSSRESGSVSGSELSGASGEKLPWLRITGLILGFLFLLLHFVSGMEFFVLLLRGAAYYM